MPSPARLVTSSVFAFHLVTIFLVTGLGLAQEPLRWRLHADEKLNVNSSYKTSFSLAPPLEQLSCDTDEQERMSWRVMERNAANEYRIRIHFDRLQYSMTGKLGQAKYDSNSDTQSIGLSADSMAQYRYLLQNEFELLLSDRGEIKNIRKSVSNDATHAAAELPRGLSDADVVRDISACVSRCSFVLPARGLRPNELWTESKTDNSVLGVGKQTAKLTYSYDGIKIVNGSALAILKAKNEISFAATPDLQLNIKQQTSDGEIAFDTTRGRVMHDNLMLDSSFEVVLRGMTTPGKLSMASCVDFEDLTIPSAVETLETNRQSQQRSRR